MAKNFKMVTSGQTNRSLRIRLHGDFDGTSAHELANMLTDLRSSFSKVAIDTDGLKTIHAFGLTVFGTQLKKLRRISTRVMFSGKFKDQFTEE